MFFLGRKLLRSRSREQIAKEAPVVYSDVISAAFSAIPITTTAPDVIPSETQSLSPQGRPSRHSSSQSPVPPIDYGSNTKSYRDTFKTYLSKLADLAIFPGMRKKAPSIAASRNEHWEWEVLVECAPETGEKRTRESAQGTNEVDPRPIKRVRLATTENEQPAPQGDQYEDTFFVHDTEPTVPIQNPVPTGVAHQSFRGGCRFCRWSTVCQTVEALLEQLKFHDLLRHTGQLAFKNHRDLFHDPKYLLWMSQEQWVAARGKERLNMGLSQGHTDEPPHIVGSLRPPIWKPSSPSTAVPPPPKKRQAKTKHRKTIEWPKTNFQRSSPHPTYDSLASYRAFDSGGPPFTHGWSKLSAGHSETKHFATPASSLADLDTTIYGTPSPMGAMSMVHGPGSLGRTETLDTALQFMHGQKPVIAQASGSVSQHEPSSALAGRRRLKRAGPMLEVCRNASPPSEVHWSNPIASSNATVTPAVAANPTIRRPKPLRRTETMMDELQFMPRAMKREGA